MVFKWIGDYCCVGMVFGGGLYYCWFVDINLFDVVVDIGVGFDGLVEWI